jgi:hypothetical protein
MPITIFAKDQIRNQKICGGYAVGQIAPHHYPLTLYVQA